MQNLLKTDKLSTLLVIAYTENVDWSDLSVSVSAINRHWTRFDVYHERMRARCFVSS